MADTYRAARVAAGSGEGRSHDAAVGLAERCRSHPAHARHTAALIGKQHDGLHDLPALPRAWQGADHIREHHGLLFDLRRPRKHLVQAAIQADRNSDIGRSGPESTNALTAR